jgi:threonyl-tRNA synthetase
MIHRAPFGSLERFVAVLIEHCAGKFPLWLTPEQCIILPISDKYNEYAQKVSRLLENCEIRSLIDERAEKIGKKIRDAEIQKIPFMLIIGEKEEAENVVSVRKQATGDLGSMSVEGFVDLINKEIDEKLKE